MAVKALVLFPDDNHTGPAILGGLRNLGVESILIDSLKAYGNLIQECDRLNPEIIICCRQGHLLKSLREVRGKHPGTKIICWNTDSRGAMDLYADEFGPELVDLFCMCDHTYNIATGEVEMFVKEGLSSSWLVQGINPEISNKPSNCGRYNHEITFLGGVDWLHEKYGNRTTLLRELYSAGHDVNIEYARGADASRIYYQSAVNLGHAHTRVRGENSVRDFKIMGSGGFLITQYWDGIEEHINLGVEAESYKTHDECLEKVMYYLEHEEERERIAQAGYEACHDRHKYSDRLKVIIEDYKNV